mgnify:CR=1
MKIKRDKIDTVFSNLVRERAEWVCEVCKKFFPEGRRQALHCSHFYSRRHRGLRWHPVNAAAMCFGCHDHLGGNPVEFARWVEKHLGKPAAGKLRRWSKRIVKFSKPEREEIHAFLKDELSRITCLRGFGALGRIEIQTAPIILERLDA